jgi:putrescine aminotransferase
VTERAAVLDLYRRHVNRSLARLADMMSAPIVERAEGSCVYTADGEELLDCGGYGIFILGHSPEGVVEPVVRQLRKLALTGPMVFNAELPQAAEALARAAPSGLEYVYFTNSGAEACETALKLARLAGKTRVVATHGGYHGKTLGALAVTGNAHYRDPFEPLLPGVDFVPYGDSAAAEQRLSSDCCLIVEPVQGEAGVRIPPDGYMTRLREATARADALLIVDEIQTGLGRLGDMWGVDRERVVPDLMLVGKALSGGLVPVGAVLATPEVFAPLNRDAPLHTSTFGGNPLAAVAAQHALAAVVERDVPRRARELGATVREIVDATVVAHCGPLVREVRSRGLLLALEFVDGAVAGRFMLELLDRRVIVSSSANAPGVLRLTPSAFLGERELQWLADALDRSAVAVTRSRAVRHGQGAPVGTR